MRKSYCNMGVLDEKLRGNLGSVVGRIEQACLRARREPADVRMIAVTKYAPIEAIAALVRLGMVDLGESRVQQLVERREYFEKYPPREEPDAPPIRWHMIGQLQRNKVKPIVPFVTLIHTVDRLRLVEDISKRAESVGRRVDVLLEVNGGDEPQKGGAAVCAAAHLGEQIASMPALRLRGLMSMAPNIEDGDDVRRVFTRVRELYDEMRSDYDVGAAFNVLSMGMSSDFEIAVECGANLVRIGSALFEGMQENEESILPSV